jgi:hypothetical protein
MERPLIQVYVVKAGSAVVENSPAITEIEGVFATLDAAKAFCEWGVRTLADYHDGLVWTDVGYASGGDKGVYWWRGTFNGGNGDPIYFVEPHRVWFDGETE